MNLNDIKDLMAQFDQSSLREFSYKNGTDELQFSKNEARLVPEVAAQVAPAPVLATPSQATPTYAPAETVAEEVPAPAETSVATDSATQPATPKYVDGQKELPNTGTEDNARLAALGLLGVLSGFGLVARKKKED